MIEITSEDYINMMYSYHKNAEMIWSPTKNICHQTIRTRSNLMQWILSWNID